MCPHTYIHDVIHTSTTHASYTRVLFSVYLFRHEHAAAVRGVTHESREGVRGRAQRLPPRGERSEPLRTSTTAQRMSGNLLLPLPRMMRRLGLGRAGYVSPDIHTYHTYLSFSRYVCFPRHTYIPITDIHTCHFLAMSVSPHIHTLRHTHV